MQRRRSELACDAPLHSQASARTPASWKLLLLARPLPGRSCSLSRRSWHRSWRIPACTPRACSGQRSRKRAACWTACMPDHRTPRSCRRCRAASRIRGPPCSLHGRFRTLDRGPALRRRATRSRRRGASARLSVEPELPASRLRPGAPLQATSQSQVAASAGHAGHAENRPPFARASVQADTGTFLPRRRASRTSRSHPACWDHRELYAARKAKRSKGISSLKLDSDPLGSQILE